MSKDLRVGIGGLKGDVNLILPSVQRTQRILNGEMLVGGRNLSVLIRPTPQILASAQVVASDVQRIDGVLTSGEQILYDTNSAFQVMVILVIVFSLSLLFFALVGSVLHLRKLVLVGAITTPVVSVVIWVVAGTIYGSWNHAKDLNYAVDTYMSLSAVEQLESQLHLMVPCPDSARMAMTLDQANYATAAIIRVANDIIERALHYILRTYF